MRIVAPLSAEKITTSRRPLTLLWHLHSEFSFLAETTSLRKQRSKTYSAISDHEIKVQTINFILPPKKCNPQEFIQVSLLTAASEDGRKPAPFLDFHCRLEESSRETPNVFPSDDQLMFQAPNPGRDRYR